MSKFISALLGVSVLAVAATAQAEGRVMSNDLSQCRNGPSTLVQISGVKASTGKIRVQSYRGTAADWLEKGRWRSEEHTSELQSLMRISYAVFCLKKKKK